MKPSAADSAPFSHPKPRRVLLLSAFFPSHGGGIEKVADELAQRLAQDANFRFEWLASSGDALPLTSPGLKIGVLRVWNGIEKRCGVPIPLPGPRAWGRLWRAIARADIVHMHDFAYPAHLGAVLFCLAQRKPYLVTQHIGAVPFRSPALRWALRQLNFWVGRLALGRAARVIFISDEVRRYFESFASMRALTLPNGVDATVFSPVAATRRAQLRRELAQELDFDSETPLLLFVGRFVEKKGVLLLVELSKQLPHITWIFAGRGPLDPIALGAGENVRVVRDRRGAAIADLFRAADALILPSQGEGFPLVVQEALACGTPVLAGADLEMALPRAAELIQGEIVGETDDLPRWKARIEAMLMRRETQTSRRTRAELAAELWNWDHAAREMAALYHSILMENRSRKTESVPDKESI